MPRSSLEQNPIVKNPYFLRLPDNYIKDRRGQVWGNSISHCEKKIRRVETEKSIEMRKDEKNEEKKLCKEKCQGE